MTLTLLKVTLMMPKPKVMIRRSIGFGKKFPHVPVPHLGMKFPDGTCPISGCQDAKVRTAIIFSLDGRALMWATVGDYGRAISRALGWQDCVPLNIAAALPKLTALAQW